MTHALDLTWRRRWQIGLAAAILIGIVFRLAFINDIEFKSDELWTFNHTEAFFQTHEWPLVGSMSSQGLPNPPLSLWQFIVLETFVPADPQSVTRAVEIVNCLTLLLLALFIWRGVEKREKEVWYWALALISVNPLSVLFSRKIWEQDLLPPYALALLLGWWHRDRRWGAFLWGLSGALIGQVHMGGFYYAAAFFLVSLFYGRRETNWNAWLLGTSLGLIPALPWLYALSTAHLTLVPSDFANLLPVYVIHWLRYATGLGLVYALGRDVWNFLAWPSAGGISIYFTGLLHAALFLLQGLIFARLFHRWRIAPHETWALLFSPESKTALALGAAFVVQGVLLTLSMRGVFLHYLIITFPFTALSLAWLDRAGVSGIVRQSRGLLSAIVVGQAMLTLLFQLYVHQATTIDGDYGTPWHAQAHASIGE